ncbi:type IV secretion system DNA-binding domain-containing protein [Actinocatenispora comari]|uniref:Type VI secretion protein n=1 Tax=Actinocatenispora comari TaxID=2807577 RepID=A0A8J4A889_9ACTN|nr:type IV secretion system DNA-binding domain-containing protein [Actinocatenispora comari]GIL25504.1 hypothetical protein NUM_07590 [Actinocatenispora comari]GIL29096.1 hypothetical protein NUM_43500 [Actinocatenispora comari]
MTTTTTTTAQHLPAHAATIHLPTLPDWPQLAALVGRPAVWAIAATLLVVVCSAGPVCRGLRQRRFTRHGRRLLIQPPPQVDPDGVSQLWATLAGVLAAPRTRRWLFGVPHVALEYTWSGRALTIGLWIPVQVPMRAVIAAVQAAWPGAGCQPATDAPPLPGGVWARGGALIPALPGTYPLEVAHSTDSLRPLLAAGAGLKANEAACVQILARPATPRQHRRLRTAAAGLRTGRPHASAPASLLRLGLDLATPGGTHRHHHRSPTTMADPLRERDARAALDKTALPHWQVAIRYAAAVAPARTSTERRMPGVVRARLTTIAHTLAASFAVYTGRNHLRRRRLARPAPVLAARRLASGALVSVQELAGLAALPLDVAVPGLDRARAKTIPAPVAVPAGGRNTKKLGTAAAGGHSVALPVADARQHLHVLGATGSGKSTLLCNMICDDLAAGRGAVVLDPKGDLVTDILDRLPASAADKVWLLDPDQDHTPVLNPLDGNDHDLVADNICGIFARIFQRHWGPRIDDVLRVACLTLLRHANATLTLVPPLLQNKQFRARMTADLTDPDGLGGFWEWYEEMNPGLRAQIIGPVLARLRAVLLRDFARRTLGQPRSTLNMSQILDHGGLLLARLPKGALGEDTCRLLGSFVLAQVWQTATTRTAMPEAKRRDASLYADECQNFLTLPHSVDTMLAEARGYRLSLVLAHQDLSQLPAETAAAISTNARNKLYFACGPEDARILSRHTLPELDDHDLSHLHAHTAAARLMVANQQTAAFTLATPPPRRVLGAADHLRRCAAARAATDEQQQVAALHQQAGFTTTEPEIGDDAQ